MTENSNLNDRQRVEQAYARREDNRIKERYSVFNKSAIFMFQERERVLLSMLEKTVSNLSGRRVLDIGCGAGGTLVPFVRYGVPMNNCYGIDILEKRIAHAKESLPAMHFACCSAENCPFEEGSFDLVTMFTCLSSVLDSSCCGKEML